MKIPLCKKEVFDLYAMHGNSFDDLSGEVDHSTDITTVPCLHPDKGYKEWALIKTLLCCRSIAPLLIYCQTSKDAIVMAVLCLALNQYGDKIFNGGDLSCKAWSIRHHNLHINQISVTLMHWPAPPFGWYWLSLVNEIAWLLSIKIRTVIINPSHVWWVH